MMDTIKRLESEVRGYCRSFPTVFKRAEGEWLEDIHGKRYLDFFAGAGALNYGHNNPVLREALIEYLSSGSITHGLDMTTEAKVSFLETIEEVLLKPRDLRYKMMFCGPTGTNAVESAIKLARKVTGRHHIVSFTNGYHGMTLGALALTGNQAKRDGAGVPIELYTTRMPFDGYMGKGMDTVTYMERLFEDPSSGVEKPAAFIFETIQAEGGVNVASWDWLKRIEKLARDIGALVIVDDIQVGCGRTGPFFSFDPIGMRPDMICLSKSFSGYGLPFAIVMSRPELDAAWDPGEHNGTFRGFNPAFVTGQKALEVYWRDDSFEQATLRKAQIARQRLEKISEKWGGEVRGRGLIQGIAWEDHPEVAGEISKEAFKRDMIVETAGAQGQVLKLLPSLTIRESSLQQGLDIIEECVGVVMDRTSSVHKVQDKTAPTKAESPKEISVPSA